MSPIFNIRSKKYSIPSSNCIAGVINDLSRRQFQIVFFELKIEPVHEISNNVVCATSKASDQSLC